MASGEDWALTGADLVVGTALHMAPEQLTGEPISPQTDIYALATLLYQMLSGRFPFEGTYREIQNSKLNEAPPSLLELGVDVDESFSALMEAALNLSPNSRPKDAIEIVKAMKQSFTLRQDQPFVFTTFEALVLNYKTIWMFW